MADDYTVIATGPAPPSRAAQIGGAFGEGLGVGAGALFADWLGTRRKAKQLNPLREALEQNILQMQQSGVPLNPVQQQIAAVVSDPKAYARLAGSPEGSLQLAQQFQQQARKPAHFREFVVRHGDELNDRLKIGLQPGESATVKLAYDETDTLLPGFEVQNVHRASEGGDESTMFGTGLRGRSFEYVTNMAPAFAEGKLTPDEERVFLTAVTNLTTPERYNDPDTGLLVERPGRLPPFAIRALEARGFQVSDAGVLPPLGSQAGQPGQPDAATVATADSMKTVPPELAFPAQEQGTPSLWELAGTGDVTGPMATIARGLHRLPGALLGEFPEQTEAGTYVSGIKERLIDGLRRNPRYAEGEADRLFKAIDVRPGTFDSASAFQSRVIGFDDVLEQIEREMDEVVSGRRELVSGETRRHAMDTLQIVRNTRQILAPPRMRSEAQANEFIRTSVPGTKFLFREGDKWVMYEVEPR